MGRGVALFWGGVVAEGPGTAEGYRPPVDEGGRRRGRLVWVRLPTAHEGPPYAHRLFEEESGAVEAADEERHVDDAGSGD